MRHYKDFKNPIMLKITNQIEKLIKNPQLDKNTLVTMSNFDVINSKLDKIITKTQKPEIQLVKTSNQQQTQNPHVNSTWTQKTVFVIKKISIDTDYKVIDYFKNKKPIFFQ